MIIAKQDILYQGKAYRPGDTLPEQDLFQVGLWLKAGSAHRVAEKRKKEKAPVAPADEIQAPAPAAILPPEGGDEAAPEKQSRKQARGKAQEEEADDAKPVGTRKG